MHWSIENVANVKMYFCLEGSYASYLAKRYSKVWNGIKSDIIIEFSALNSVNKTQILFYQVDGIKMYFIYYI